MITDEQRRWRLAHRHRLLPELRTDDPVQIADDLVALHSSDPASVYLSAFVRMNTPSVDALSGALYRERTLVRHHAMRRTIWVMTPDICRLAHGAATAKIARAERKRTVRDLEGADGIDDGEAWLDASIAEVIDLLNRDGHRQTRVLGTELPHLVFPVTRGAQTKHPASVNSHTMLLQGAGFDAKLTRTAPGGDWTSSDYAWSPTEAWLGHPIAGMDEGPAAEELLARWLLRFGPATDTDISWWFGWTATLRKASLAAVGAVEVPLEGDITGWLHPDDVADVEDPGPWVRLLPGLDPTTMGWKERDWYLQPDDVGDLFDRSLNAGPTVWADGRVVGGWGQRPDGTIEYELTATLSDAHRKLLDDAVDQMAAALGDVVVRPRFPAPLQKRIFAS